MDQLAGPDVLGGNDRVGDPLLQSLAILLAHTAANATAIKI